MDERALVIWVTDSGCFSSVHKNQPGLSFRDSFLGVMIHEAGQWGYRLRDTTKVLVGSYAKAREALEKTAIAEIEGKS